MKTPTLLYITFIDMNADASSGSSVRPRKMLRAFEELGVNIKLISGATGVRGIGQRKKAVREAETWLRSHRPDCCYIEPPSGPMFYPGDVRLIRKLHKMGVPVGLFYRDAFWKFPSWSMDDRASFTQRVKFQAAKAMQIAQWNAFQKNCDILYFPKLRMAGYFKGGNRKELPPGCFTPDITDSAEVHAPLRFLFVGGAAKNHGTFLTLDAFEQVNRERVRASLTYICQKEAWDALNLSERVKNDPWLEVVHASGDDQLRPYYEWADVAILAAPSTEYRNMGIPVKIFEYLSYLKPMLVTDCGETGRTVRENGIGWVTDDTPDAVAEKIVELTENPEEILKVKAGLKAVRERNLWRERAAQVLRDLCKEYES